MTVKDLNFACVVIIVVGIVFVHYRPEDNILIAIITGLFLFIAFLCYGLYGSSSKKDDDE